MKWSTGALCATLLVLAAAPGASAQSHGAMVLPPGSVRLSGGGEYASFDALFGASGKTGVGESIRGPLVTSAFPALSPLYENLGGFLASTAGRPGAGAIVLDPDDLSLGEVDAALFMSRVHVPMRIEAGIFRRVQVGVQLPLVRGRQLVERLGITGATVGANPDAAGNANLLARLGGNGRTLGGLSLLPTAESPAGRELQNRVRAATGDTLTLPHADSVRGTVLQSLLADAYGVEGLASSAELWRAGDLEIDLRVSLLDGLRGAAYPDSTSRGLAIRAAAFGGVRLPTGIGSDTVTLFGRDPDVGLSGYELGAGADLFFGARRSITVTLRQITLTSGDVLRRVAPLDAPLSTLAPASELRWNPGDTLQLRIAPQYRLADPIVAGIEYELQRATGGSYDAPAGTEGAELLATSGGTSHRIGAGVRFTSLPAFGRRESGIPLEVSLSWARLLAGPEGMAAESRVQLEGSLYVALWGRGIGR